MDENLSNLADSTDKPLILIVDDSADNLRVLATALQPDKYEVRCVKSGAMALLAIKARGPDLILLDIKMPEMNGYQLCQRLKSMPQTADIPVIFLSALDKVQVFEVGGTDYITKPFQIEEVLVRVKNQLTLQQLHKQLIEKKSTSPPLAAGNVPNTRFKIFFKKLIKYSCKINFLVETPRRETAISDRLSDLSFQSTDYCLPITAKKLPAPLSPHSPTPD
jgi:CheY-like chemotaxis protein